MTRTTTKQLLITALASLALVWLGLQLFARRGVYLSEVSWQEIFAYLILSGLVTWGGLTVRAYLAGKKPNLSGLNATRLAVFAKACALGGMLFVGWYGAQALLALENFSIESQQSRALWAGIAVVASIVLSVCGLIAERNCQIPPAQSDQESVTPAGKPA